MPQIDWINGSYEHASPNVAVKRSVNLYTESTEGEGRVPAVLIGTPGTNTFTQTLSTPVEIQDIQGTGSSPNIVIVNTTSPHGLVAGQIFNVNGTTNYDQNNIAITQILSTTSFNYTTNLNTYTSQNVGGSIIPTGASPITDVYSGANCRGLYTTSTGRVFTCFESGVYEIFGDGTWNRIHTISNTTTPVSFADNGRSLVWCDGTNAYTYKFETSVVAQIDFDYGGSPFMLKPTKVLYSNYRIVIINDDETDGNNNKFFWSGILDADTWEPLDYASAESNSDPIISSITRQGDIVFFGPRSLEVWSPDSNPDLPYRYVGGSATQVGCGAKYSVAGIGDSVFWLGASNSGQHTIYTLQGYNPVRISNHALEHFLTQNAGATSDAIGFCYQQNGHSFYVITFIQANKTFCYDLLTGKWHERATRDQLMNVLNYWSVLYATSAFDKVLAGSLGSARLFTLDLDRYTEWDGTPIVRLHQGPVIAEDMKMVFHKEFQIDMETGVGTQLGEPYNAGIQTNYGSNPVMLMQHSDDGGHTWSSERWTEIGKVGDYRARVRWKRLGRSRERVYRIVMSDPVKCVILGGRVLVGEGVQP